MLYECDNFIGPGDRVVEAGIVTICAEKQSHRREASALISLLERMCSGDPGHQRNRQHDDVLFAITEEIPRARYRTFQESDVSNKMRFAGLCQFEPIVFDDDFDRQPLWFIWQEQLVF